MFRLPPCKSKNITALLKYTQNLYPICRSCFFREKAPYEKVLPKYPYKQDRQIGKFSLVIFLLLGIFFQVRLEAVQTIPVDNIASGVYNASFSFNIDEFAPRSQIYPDRVYFNASGSLETFSPVSAYVADYSDWKNNYPTNENWSAATSFNSSKLSVFFKLGQVPQDKLPSLTLPVDTIIKSRISRVSALIYNLELLSYSDEGTLISAPDPTPMFVAPNVSTKPHAMVVSKSRIYLFWLESDNRIHVTEHSGTSAGPSATLPYNDIDTGYGLDAALINQGGSDYIALIYAKSDSEIAIVSFPDGNYSSPTVTPVSVNKVSPVHAKILQNPRTGFVYLIWLDDTTHKYYKSQTPGAFDFNTSVEETFDGLWRGDLGFSAEAFDNFEMDFSFLKEGTFELNNLVLKADDSVKDTFANNGRSCLFRYRSGNKQYAALLSSLTGMTYYFRKRLLEFPQQHSWNKNTKMLHIEGPPIFNSTVTAEVDFAEIATASCIAQTVNSAGGRTSFVAGNNFITSSGNLISVVFQKAMNLDNSLINTKIKMFDSSDGAIAIVPDTSFSSEIRFRLNEQLNFSSSYYITIASDVLDANGSQIWSDSRLNFTTQPAKSAVLASEVIKLTAHSSTLRNATDLINDNDEINATTTLYLRLEAVDPAFNTSDVGTVTVILNGSSIAEVSVTETAVNSGLFDGVYNLTAPNGGNNLYEFVSAQPTIKTSVRVEFPTLVSVNPGDGSSGVLIDNKPQLTFSESLAPASVNTDNVKLTRGVDAANYSLSLSGSTITIDPSDSSENYLFTETLYQIAAGYGLTDLKGNPFVHTPATFTSVFTTQASQTRPISIATATLFSDAAYSLQLAADADYSATGTVYIEFTGVDGAGLTRDYAIASISNGILIRLEETASSSAVYRGSYSFSSLPDRFRLTAQSVKSPAVSASLLITYPQLSPDNPASSAANVSLSSNIIVAADEALDPATVNSTNVKLFQNGTEVGTSLSYAAGKITIDPSAALLSEKTYLVRIAGVKDVNGNPMQQPLVYQFTCEDLTPPSVVSSFPAQNQNGVTIDRRIQIVFSENMLASSFDSGSVKLTRSGINVNFSQLVSGKELLIDPNDSAESYLQPDTSYRLEVTASDLAGNTLTAAPFILDFSTQPTYTAPTGIDSLTIFKDPLLLEGWAANERVPASATIYLKMTGTDGATQTRDLATAVLNLSWNGNQNVTLLETASNSNGYFIGQFDLGSLPLYGFPAPQPAISIGSLTFQALQAPQKAATLTVSFPDLVNADSKVETLIGTSNAAGATDVRIDTTIIAAFNDRLIDAGDSASFRIASGGITIAGTRVLSADRQQIIFSPTSPLPFSSSIEVSGGYNAAGLKSEVGNPIFRDFSFNFTTQASQTRPLSITQVNLFADNSYSAAMAYQSNGDFPGSGIIYIEAKGTDGANNTRDYTRININNGVSLNLIETSENSGVYRGQYSFANLPDSTKLIFASDLNPLASQTLQLSYPVLAQAIPASGAVGISIFTTIEIEANEELLATSIVGTNIKLLKDGAEEIPVDLSWNSGQKRISIAPQSPLAYSSSYQVQISNQRDLVGNLQQTLFVSSFSTQASSINPTAITDLKAFSDAAYTAQIPDNGQVAPSSQVFYQITASDLSATTIDSTVIKLTSSVTASSVELALIETGVSTGVFQGSKQIFAEENATITATSLTDPTKFTRIRTLGMPTITSIQPASGSTSIFLDTRFTINTGKAVDANTLGTFSLVLSDKNGIASFLPILANPAEILIYSDLATDSDVELKINSQLRDTDGIAFPATIAKYHTVLPQLNSLSLYADAAFSTPVANNSQVEAGQTVWARINGNNVRAYNPESQNLWLSLPDATSTIALAETSAGIFSGSFSVPFSAGKSLQVIPENNPSLSLNLEILPEFSILSFSPASGAVSVPADVWPSWNFSRPVKATDANLANFSLIKVIDGSNVPGTVSQSPTTRQIRFQPDEILKLLTEYEMVVSAGVRDENDNVLGNELRTRFVSQPPPPPPTVISLFDNYESDAYATATRVVATNGTLYLKMVSTDESFSTYETARVRLDSSDGTLDGLELTLIEISPPSGIFVLAYPINLSAGTTLSIQPQVAPNRLISVKVQNRTNLLSISPASGSLDLLLDTPIRLSFSQPIKADSITTGIEITGLQRPFTFTSANAGRDIVLQPVLATGTSSLLRISSSLKDENGLFLLPTVASFATLGENFAELELFTGIAPRSNQPVSLTGEAVFAPISIVATTTNLFDTLPEKRQMTILAATQSFVLSLDESLNQPGHFTSTFDPPAGTSRSGLIASLSFASRPSVQFNFAPAPQLLETFPASNSSDACENQVIIATFSRRMAFESAQNALSIDFPGGQISATLLNQSDAEVMSWQPLFPLPLQASCTLNFSGVTDYLGQPLAEQHIAFSTSGLQGINLYNDNSFSLRIATSQLQLPVAYAEIAASSTSSLIGQSFELQVRTGTRATASVFLPLQQADAASGRYRCQLDFSPGKSLPGYNVPLLPGEWLELTSPRLTSDKKIFYYRFSGSAAPINIHQINFFQEKDFAQPLAGTLPLSALYIQLEADDLNWFTTDSTRVRVTSDADPKGFLLNLVEAGTHSNFFRGRAQIDGNISDAGSARILAQPGNRINVESETDPTVSASIVYLPESELRAVAAFPSPVRGDSLFFRFYLNFPGNVEIEVFDSAGHEVDNMLVRGREGENRHRWRLPRHLANGVYFYVMKLTDSTAYPSKKRKYRGKFAVLR